MSTLFVIKKKGKFIEVAQRHSQGIFWVNPLAEYLPSKTKVIPRDNVSQGIFTIKDIKSAIKEEKTGGK